MITLFSHIISFPQRIRALQRPVLILLFISSTCWAWTDWRIIAGLDNTFTNQFYSLQPMNLPSVSSLANTQVVTTTPSSITYTTTSTNNFSIVDYLSSASSASNYTSSSTNTYIATPATPVSVSVVDDTSYTSRKLYNTKITSNPYIGLEAPISDSWLFRIKGIHETGKKRIIDIQTFIYTPVTNASGNNIMTDYTGSIPSTETFTLTQNPQNTLAMSLLYRISQRFHTGLQFRRTKQNLDLVLSDTSNTLSATFKPTITDVGFETLYKISDYLSLNTAFHASKKQSYVKRLLNFQVNQISSATYANEGTSIPSTSVTTYGLSTIPLSTSEQGGWQACNGYIIQGETCTTSASISNSVTDYYYNASNPSTFGSSINISDLNTSIGPQLWFSRFNIYASFSLEWDLDVAYFSRRKYNKYY